MAGKKARLSADRMIGFWVLIEWTDRPAQWGLAIGATKAGDVTVFFPEDRAAQPDNVDTRLVAKVGPGLGRPRLFSVIMEQGALA